MPPLPNSTEFILILVLTSLIMLPDILRKVAGRVEPPQSQEGEEEGHARKH